jgi:hypothetical protein
MLHCYIIVPYRARGNQTERRQQLEYFIPYMNNYMKQFNIKYTLMVIEQNDDKLFNRGKLFNIGMLEACKLFVEGEKPYFCHQNVDLIPQKIDYSLYSEGITDVWGYHLGLGAMYFTDLESYVKINGYPNDYDGWGADDIILLDRCKFNNISVKYSLRDAILINQSEVFKTNNPDIKNLFLLDIGVQNRDKWVNVKTAENNLEKNKKENSQPETFIKNGLNTCIYHVDSINETTYKHFFVSWD